MNVSLKEGKLLLKWFDIAVEGGTLDDKDLKLYDRIRDIVGEDDDDGDPLVYNPRKKVLDDDFDYDSEESHYDMDAYSDEDKY